MSIPVMGNWSSSTGDLITTILPDGGEPIDDVDVVSVSWNTTISRGAQKKRGVKVAHTIGSPEHTASIEVYSSGWIAMRRALIAQSKARGFADDTIRIGNIKFGVLCKRKPIDALDFEILLIEGCVIDDLGESFEESEDPHTVPLTLNPLRIFQIVDGEKVCLG
mgnify:CR=1 FL=1